MRLVRHLIGAVTLVAALAAVGTAAAQDEKKADKIGQNNTPAVVEPVIDYGDDTSRYANDGECDDPRFSGPGVDKKLLVEDLRHDAADCSAAVAAGTVTFNSIDPSIQLGDNTSSYADNGECDDPRFEGPGVASVLISGDLLHDSADCEALLIAGQVNLIPVFRDDYAAGAPYDASGIAFGNDSSSYANNSTCDDPRFVGPGAAETLLDDDMMRDAADCQSAFIDGRIALRSDAEANPDVDLTVYTSTTDPTIDFGTNSSDYANNGECDDPRFSGPGVASTLLSSDLNRDARDCSELLDAGQVSIMPVWRTDYAAGAPFDTAGVDFGDNSSAYADNDECDDPQFVGPGMASTVLDDDLKRDSVDCIAEYEAGRIMLKDAALTPDVNVQPVVELDAAIDFGDNTSEWKDDGQCDDPRFAGEGVASLLISADLLHDAADCQSLFTAGKVTLIPVWHPDYAAGAPFDVAGVDFGDNSSDYKDNTECDDPRFAGPGMALTVLEEDTLHDSADCQAAFEAGRIALKE